MSSAYKPLIITPGDPEGVGAEISCRALAQRIEAGEAVSVVLVGEPESIIRAAGEEGLAIEPVDSIGQGSGVGVPLLVPEGTEPVEVAAIIEAVGSIRRGLASALVTGPVSKASITDRGYPFKGHTELLGRLCGNLRPVMGFAGGSFRLVLVTTHLPLRHVADAITASRVICAIRAGARAMRDQLGIAEPRLIVCGLNPHAGESGLLGSEEIDEIIPAIARARLEGIDAVGPVSSEAAFRMVEGESDMIVAMYHDQGLGPLKLADFGQSVNWTLGLPMIRTSVDHGTAKDIAWQRAADVTSMHSAIRWAERLVRARAAG